MLTIHVWPKRLKEFLLTHPLYKSPGQARHLSLLVEGGAVALYDKRQYCVTKPKDALRSTLLTMATGD